MRKLISRAKAQAFQRRNGQAPLDRLPDLFLTAEDFGQARLDALMETSSAKKQTKARQPEKPVPPKPAAQTKPRQLSRAAPEPTSGPQTQDSNVEFVESSSKSSHARRLMSDIVGCEGVVRKLEGYRLLAESLRSNGMDPSAQIPNRFVFKGPAGIGKRTVAQKLAKLFKEVDLLPTGELIERDASIPSDEKSGLSADNVSTVLREAADKVLFIKNAHKLGARQSSALTTSLSERSPKIVVILAGPMDALNKLLSDSRPLSRCFPEEVAFIPLNPQECTTLLHQQIKSSGVGLNYLKGRPTSIRILEAFADLSSLSSWGNGREVKALAKSIVDATYGGAESLASSLTLSEDAVVTAINEWHETKSGGKPRWSTEKVADDSWVNVEVRVEEVDVDSSSAEATSDPQRSASLPSLDGSTTPATTPEIQEEGSHASTAPGKVTDSKEPWSSATHGRKAQGKKKKRTINAELDSGSKRTENEVDELISNLQGMNLG